jgi:glycosyltransferase involved in cell wall biosynthesis
MSGLQSIPAAPARSAVLLVVPPGRWDLARETAESRERHGVESVTILWCGDPQLRPPAPAHTTYGSLPSDWELRLISTSSEAARLVATEFCAQSLREGGIERIIVDHAREGAELPLRLPGGVLVDDLVRRSVSSALQSGRSSDTPASPWRCPVSFRRWITPRYMAHLRTSPSLAGGRSNQSRLLAEEPLAWRNGATSSAGEPSALPGLTEDHLTVVEPLRQDGFNLVGYLTLEMSLGDVARRLGDSAEAAGVGVARIAHLRADSPAISPLPMLDQEIRFETTVAVVTADQFGFFADDYPTIFELSRKMIGYWFWELEHIPQHMIEAMHFVDEIWAGSRFVRDNFAAATDKPVRYVPIAVPEPLPSTKTRSDFRQLQPFQDRPVFLVVFDYFSIMERKNPIGAIEAFRMAFEPNEGPILVVKSMHADDRVPQRERVVASAVDRADIVLWDEYLSRPDQMALIAAADCLVSLHRSEGLGLHMAEAMWLGTPTIATRYSGNLDFQDDDCALLVDAVMAPVRHGQGIYPESASWADPDLVQASQLMRRIAADPQLRSSLSAAGRRRMENQSSPTTAGAAIATALRDCH